MMDLAVINCRQLVTLAGPARPRTGLEMRDLGIIDNGILLIKDGRVAEAGTRMADAKEVIDAQGRIVLPGFVDAHTHPVFAGNRAAEFEKRIEGATYAEIAAAGGGIRSTVRQTRAATEEELLTSTRKYQEWFLSGGTTTVEAKTGYGLSLESELKMLRVIRAMGYIPTFLGAHEIPDEYRGRIDHYVDLVIHEMLPNVDAEFCDVFCEPTVFPQEQSRRILAAAKARGMNLRVHADQFTPDYGTAVAAEFQATTADHLEHTTRDGAQALKSSGTIPVLLPASVYSLGLKKYPNARMLIEEGLPVVIATDFNPGSSPTTSMLMVLSLACTQMRMTPAEAITASTINAAWSLNRGNQIGSLEPGKQADFAIHNCSDYRELPYFLSRPDPAKTHKA